MNLDELEKLADEESCNGAVAVWEPVLRQLIARQRELETLCKMQHEALFFCGVLLFEDDNVVRNALAAYEESVK